jgi:hypothetical protein
MGHGRRGKTAIKGVTGKPRRIAEVFSMRAAVAAAPTRVAQPRDTDPVAWLQALYTGTDCRDTPDDFMARNQRKMRMRQFPVDDMKISATDAAGSHIDQYLSPPGRAVR